MSENTSANGPNGGGTGSAPWAKANGAAGTPWGRVNPAKSRATERKRKTIDGLPDWEPTPPGEVSVQRGRRDG